MAKLTEKIARIAFGDIISRGISFITTIYLARVLGAEGYGLVTIALAFLGYAVWVSDLGLLNIGARETAKDPEKRVFRTKEIFMAKILMGILVFVLSAFIVPLLNIGEEQKQLMLGFSYSLIPYAFLMEWYYNGRQKFGKVAISKTSNSLVYLSLVFLFVKSRNQLNLIPFLYTAGISTSALVITAFSIKEHPFNLPLRGWHVFRDLLKSASTLGFGWFFMQVLQLLPPLAIGLFISARDAGLYGAAIRIIFIAMLVDRIFVNLLLPNLSAQWNENKAQASAHLSMVSRLILLFGSTFSLFIAIAAPVIIDLFYGDEFAVSAKLLVFLTILLFATFPNSLFSFGLVAMGKDSEFFKSTLVSGTITGIIVLGFAQYTDLETVTLAISFCEIMIASIAFYWFSRFVKIKFAAPAIISAVLAVLIFYITTLTKLPLLLEAFAAVGVFIPLLYFTRVFSREHLLWLKERIS